MFRVLVQILGGNPIAAGGRFPRQGYITLEYLVGAAADLDVGPVALKRLIALRNSWLLPERAVCVKATARPLV